MKQLLVTYLFPFFAFICCASVIAQRSEGIVTYTESIKLKIEVPEGMDAEAFKKMVPSEQKAEKVLYFNEKTALYTDAPEQSQEPTEVVMGGQEEEGGMQVNMKIMRPENRQYRDMDKGERIESTEFFGRFFLISEKTQKMKWKVTNEQKQILSYNCQKAILQDTSRQVEAWFTAQIPAAIGPGEYADLPGLILEISMMGGDRTVVANKVELKTIDEKLIEAPTKGKAVSRKKFNEIRDEKMKEMGAEPGGGGAMKIIIKN